MKLFVNRTRNHPTNHALAFDARAVFNALGFVAAFALGIVLLVATSKPAHVNHSDDGIMGANPIAGKTPERKLISDGRF